MSNTPIEDEYPDLISDVEALPTTFLECRTLGHAWSIHYMGPVGRSKDHDLIRRADDHIRSPDGARVLQCARCETERIDLCYVGYGRKVYHYELVGRQYRYPDHYRVPGAHQHRDLLHEEMFDRVKTGRRQKGKK